MEINCLHFERIHSTNSWCKEHYAEFDVKKITMVSAGQQLAGRGRFNRQWLSPPNESLSTSFTFFLPLKRKDIGNITQVLALSTITTLENKKFDARIKWPNDIILNNKKLGGILCETITTDKYLVVIVGIGLNVNIRKEDLEKIGQPATSLLNESQIEYTVSEIIQSLQTHFASDLDIFLREGFAPFHKLFSEKIVHHVGDEIKVNHQKCLFQGIDEDGALLVLKDNRLQKIVAGEVS